MRYFPILSLFLAVLVFSCNNDDDGLGLDDTLHYDGPNAAAPLLPPADYEAAARFTDFELGEFIGEEVTEVIFYFAGIPSSTTIRIYDEGSAESPGGSTLYQASVSGSLQPGWNVHRVRSPVEITGEDLWVSVGFTHNGNFQSIGCDDGPAHPDGGWIYSTLSNQWETFQESAGESINWNIRVRIE